MGLLIICGYGYIHPFIHQMLSSAIVQGETTCQHPLEYGDSLLVVMTAAIFSKGKTASSCPQQIAKKANIFNIIDVLLPVPPEMNITVLEYEEQVPIEPAGS